MNPKFRGFTLLEILIALLIFAIVALIMTQALRSAINSEARTEVKATEWEALQTAILVMSRDIEQAVDRPINEGQGPAGLAFIGKTASLTFTHMGYANPGAKALRSTLQRVSYTLQNRQLMRTNWESLDPDTHTRSHQRALLTQVDSVQFEYIDEKNRLQTAWPTGEMSHNGALPRAVRVTIQLKTLGKLQQFYLIAGEGFKHGQP